VKPPKYDSLFHFIMSLKYEFDEYDDEYDLDDPQDASDEEKWDYNDDEYYEEYAEDIPDESVDPENLPKEVQSNE